MRFTLELFGRELSLSWAPVEYDEGHTGMPSAALELAESDPPAIGFIRTPTKPSPCVAIAHNGGST